MKVNIIYVGNIKDKYYADAVAEYEKRLNAYCQVTNIELKDEQIKDGASQSEIAAAIRKEGDKILAVLPQRAYNIALCVEGEMLSSEQLAERIDRITTGGESTVNFIVGGAFGMDPRVKQLADLRLSFSRMTFTHRMMRVMLIEQIYRAMNINAGGKYHK